ncbi:DUF1127 domain-containing protein [Pseudomonas sp. MMS21-TM103]|uniref:DUF1127 domain-containing protein n=1 Tax=Pseudomonas sp. MMS21 TM103 TaxID=2886506 RepID=UPI001EDDDA4B|nr:DUF1127 domain-containing protein [Pseudomonas sp. MMS21 TM103]MCG4453013.1 DUF1127 domain-containing protein [Pseudomonas sp. MMS21 TM103]
MERILSDSPAPFEQPYNVSLARLRGTIKRWQLNIRTRRQLARLDPHLLADAGISPGERLAELEKPFWR